MPRDLKWGKKNIEPNKLQKIYAMQNSWVSTERMAGLIFMAFFRHKPPSPIEIWNDSQLIRYYLADSGWSDSTQRWMEMEMKSQWFVGERDRESSIINANWFNYQDVSHTVYILTESMHVVCVRVFIALSTHCGASIVLYTVDLIGTKLSRFRSQRAQ